MTIPTEPRAGEVVQINDLRNDLIIHAYWKETIHIREDDELLEVQYLCSEGSGMKFEFDGKYFLVFPDGIRYEIEKDLWERLKKLKEGNSL